MTGIIDYGVGNLFSLSSSLAAIGAETIVTGDKNALSGCERIILPGVGAFADAAARLRERGMDVFLKERAASGVPILGICLGMQLLFENSMEYGQHEGLGLLTGSVVPISSAVPAGLKIPHMGWNSLHLQNDGRLFKEIPEETYVYFVHSYYLQAEEPEIVKATTQYGVTIHASVEKDNIFACQFHPEKSSDTGLQILKNFVEL